MANIFLVNAALHNYHGKYSFTKNWKLMINISHRDKVKIKGNKLSKETNAGDL